MKKSNKITSNGPCDPSLEVRKSCRKIVDEDISTNFSQQWTEKKYCRSNKKNLNHILISQKLAPVSHYDRCRQ